jgi:hypothetical protein
VSEDSNFEIVGEATDGLEAVACAEKLMQDLLLMDLLMPTMSGIEAIKEIKKRYPATRSIALRTTVIEYSSIARYLPPATYLLQLEKYYSPHPTNTLNWKESIIQNDSNFFLKAFSFGTPLNSNMSLIIIAGVERTPYRRPISGDSATSMVW